MGEAEEAQGTSSTDLQKEITRCRLEISYLREQLDMYRPFGTPVEIIDLQQIKIILEGTARILGLKDPLNLAEVPKIAQRRMSRIYFLESVK